MIQNNYTPVMYARLLLFPVAFVWAIVFSFKTQLGINFLMLVLFTCIMAIIAIGFAMAKVPTVASGTTLMYVAGVMLFTTTYVFNPPSKYFAVYLERNEPRIVSYAQEPWVDRYNPRVWKEALFYQDGFSTTAKKYVEFDKEDILVTLSVKFKFSSDFAKENFTKLNEKTDERDIATAIEVTRALIVNATKDLLASEEFQFTIQSLNQTLEHVSPLKLHEMKVEVFRGALQNLIHKRARGEEITTLLYIPVLESAQISVEKAIYTRPTGN